MHKRLYPFILTAAVLLSHAPEVGATSISDVTFQKKQTENSLNSVNQEIDKIEEKQQQLRGEVEIMDSQLVDILTSISICKDEIVAKEKQVSETKDDLTEAKEQEQFQYDAMKQRIRFMYEKGDSAYLQIFLESKSLSDMLNKADYVEKLYTYDRELLETYTQIKEETKEKKELLEEEEAELLAANYELEQEQGSLEKMIAEKRKSISNFDEQLASAKEQAEQYKQELNKQTQKLRKLEEEARLKAEAEKKKAEEAKKLKEQARKLEEAAAGTKENTQGQAAQTGDSAQNSGVQENTDTAALAGSADTAGQDSANETADAQKPDDASDTTQQASDSGDAALGQKIAGYATQFVGNPYQYGGTSLTSGTDCSGFTMSVYAHFGISIPRDSTSQRSAGRAVTYEEAQPGDLICYAGHVALYIGNGQIVHASSEATGIKYGIATYRTILAVRRIV